MNHADTVHEYYRCLDEDDYEGLRAVLSASFLQRRPDRRFDGRAAFVRFMREERPTTGTEHRLDDVLVSESGIAAYGRLIGPDSEALFSFVDVFDFDADGRIDRLRTFC
ncbi:MAG: nuclear transport factor 2 family protein [Halobacteriota archaeon]